MTKRNLIILFSFLLLVLTAGCAPKCTAEEINTFIPILISPANSGELSYNIPVTFDWTHNESCRPDEYQLTIDNRGVYMIDGDITKFDFNEGFSPGTYYEWTIHARGRYTNDNAISPSSEIWSFTTDGMCSSATELEQPITTYPQFGEWLGNGQSPDPASVHISWDYSGDCFPDGFHYQLASDPAFTNIITSGITDWNRHYASISVPRCARIYWRVRARVGNQVGEYSQPSRFTYFSTSNCFQNQQSIDAALIKGFVFDDYCPSTVPWVPEGVGIFPPCVFGEPYGVHADGNRNRAPYEHEVLGTTIPADSGIPDVLVDLGAGSCPSTGLDQFHTLDNGAYYFFVQSPGTYCVSVNMDKNPALDHGIWTRPLTNQRTTSYTITLNPGEDLKIEDFGWDKYDFLKIDFWVELTSFCRAGDSKEHMKLAVVEKGNIIPLLRRNENSTWFETIVDGIPCLISIESGKPDGNPDDLPIFEPYPDPAPKPEDDDKSSGPNCSRYTDIENCNHVNGCSWTLIPGTIPLYKCLAD